MGFKKLPDGRGLIYVPDRKPGRNKKHPCPDCLACQWCSNERCRVCRAPKCSVCPKKKPSS